MTANYKNIASVLVSNTRKLSQVQQRILDLQATAIQLEKDIASGRDRLAATVSRKGQRRYWSVDDHIVAVEGTAEGVAVVSIFVSEEV